MAKASPASTMAPENIAAWALQEKIKVGSPATKFAAPEEIKPWDWQHPKVGWGLVLADNPNVPPAERGTAVDAPAPIQQLLQSRPGSPVLRWSAAHGNEVLLRYDDNKLWPCSLASSYGIGQDQIPRFLLIAASPEKVPWSFQYAANMGHCVGRLHGPENALGRYVDALLAGWADSPRDVRAPLVWSVNSGDDITWLMDQAISRKLFDTYAKDKDDDFTHRIGLFDTDATASQLVTELSSKKPAVVVTTSHGMTGPLHDKAKTLAQLGVPVDQAHQLLDLDALEATWEPDGAIWYSHACCAAGSDTQSQYAGLFDPTSDVMSTLNGVAAACGACIAPLPLRLLGHAKPLAAFIGHVEPTFDWSLRHPSTGQPLAHSILHALYDELFAGGGGRPVGWALSRIFDEAGTFLTHWSQAKNKFNEAVASEEFSDAEKSALINQLIALDRQHTVLLGCPTVTLPPIVPSTP